MYRTLQNHTARNVQDLSSRPECSVQSREFVFVGIKSCEQMFSDQIRMGLAESREASKHHTASGYRIVQAFADDLAVHRLNPTCKLDVLQ